MDGGVWKAAVHGVAEGRTRLSDFTFIFHFHALEKEMATHSSILAWRIPGSGEPGGLPSMGSHRVGHDWSDLAAAAALLWSVSEMIIVWDPLLLEDEPINALWLEVTLRVRLAWNQAYTTPILEIKKFFKMKGLKMEEGPKLTCFHRHNTSTMAQGIIPLERDLKMGRIQLLQFHVLPIW